MPSAAPRASPASSSASSPSSASANASAGAGSGTTAALPNPALALARKVSPRLGLPKLVRHDSQLKSQASKYRTALADVLRSRSAHLRRHLAKERVFFLVHLRVLLVGFVFQWVHSVSTNVVYMLHVQRQPLYDLGFELLPPLSRDWQIVSELVFFAFVTCVIGFALKPLLWERRGKARYVMPLVARYLAVLMLCQALRILSFMATVLPGPNYHCRPGSLEYNPPTNADEVFNRTDAFKGCGDLMFSSHTIFVVTCALTYQKYGSWTNAKRCMWLVVFVFGLLVVSARKHYTVDVVVAWYTVPLVWTAYEHYCPDRIPQGVIDLEEAERAAAGRPPLGDLAANKSIV